MKEITKIELAKYLLADYQKMQGKANDESFKALFEPRISELTKEIEAYEKEQELAKTDLETAKKAYKKSYNLIKGLYIAAGSISALGSVAIVFGAPFWPVIFSCLIAYFTWKFEKFVDSEVKKSMGSKRRTDTLKGGESIKYASSTTVRLNKTSKSDASYGAGIPGSIRKSRFQQRVDELKEQRNKTRGSYYDSGPH